MNIFNLSYFPKDMLFEGARTVWRSLLPDGIWILGRTVCEAPPGHDVSVLVKEGDGFRLLERYGGGSEIEEVGLGIRGMMA